MTAIDLQEGFPLGSCSRCAHTVLAYLDPTEVEPAFRCVHCDGAIDLLGHAPYGALEELGYGFVDGAEKQGHCATKGYCTMRASNGEGACGNGSCGSAGAGCASCGEP